jgi:hypothetical protein
MVSALPHNHPRLRSLYRTLQLLWAMLSGKFYGEEGAQGEEGMQVSPNLILIWVEFEGRSWQLGQS